MDILQCDLNEIFKEKTSNLKIEREETLAYIHSIFIKYVKSDKVFSNDSIIVKLADAKSNHNFEEFQDLADWIFFTSSLYPTHLNNASEDYYFVIGQYSYYKCNNMLNGKWPLFEEMADKFEYFVKSIRVSD